MAYSIKPLPPLSDSAIRRFWAKVDKRGGSDSCWPWKTSGSSVKQSTHYGTFWIGPGRASAHRVAYLLGHGVDSYPLYTLHTCDFKPCCNPAHLYAGSPKDNMRDRSERKRCNIPRGVDAPTSKLTEDQVREIRKLCAEGDLTHRQIAAMFGIRNPTVFHIKERNFWKHVV